MYKAIIKETNSSVDLLFLCLRSSDSFGAPHELNLKLFMLNGEKQKIIFHVLLMDRNDPADCTLLSFLKLNKFAYCCQLPRNTSHFSRG